MHAVEAFQATLVGMAEILSSLKIRFHLTGGVATVVYGEPRLTQDLDLVVDQPAMAAALTPFFAALSHARFLFDEATIREAVAHGTMFQVLDTENVLKLDFYPRELIAGELSRSIPIELFPGESIPVGSRVDVALSKLIWIHKGSHKGRRDLRQILRRATPGEMKTIQQMAEDRALRPLLDEVLAEPDELPE